MSEVDVLQGLVEMLVDDPDQVRVETTISDTTTIFDIHVAREDVRRVIGRQGRTAEAIRLLFTCWGQKEGRRVAIGIAEPAAGSGGLRALG